VKLTDQQMTRYVRQQRWCLTFGATSAGRVAREEREAREAREAAEAQKRGNGPGNEDNPPRISEVGR
jgi:hypothetical protein